MARFLVVLGRGLVAGLLTGAAAGVLVMTWFLAIGFDDAEQLVYAFFWLGYAAFVGGAAGVVIGVPSALLMALLSPRLRDGTDAALAGLAVAGLVGCAVVTVAVGDLLAGLAFSLVCATMGGVVGGWVVSGKRRRVEPRVEVKQ